MQKRIPHPRDGLTIQFDPKWHQYRIGNTTLRSVSKLLNHYFPFDEERILKLVSRKTGEPVDLIRRNWARQAVLGKNIHEYIEARLLQQPPPAFMHLLEQMKKHEALRPADATGPLHTKAGGAEESLIHGEEGLYIPVADEAVQRIQASYDVLAVEQVVASPEWGLAGTIDFLARNKTTNAILIGDWKTSGSVASPFRFGSFERPCTGVLRHLPNDKMYRYAMQVMVYGEILKSEDYFARHYFDAQLKRSLTASCAGTAATTTTSSPTTTTAKAKTGRGRPKKSATKAVAAKNKVKEESSDSVVPLSHYHGSGRDLAFEYGIIKLLKDECGQPMVEYKEVRPSSVLPPDAPDASFSALLQSVLAAS